MERQMVVNTGRIMKRTALALATAVLATAGSVTVAVAMSGESGTGALAGYYGQHLAWQSCQQDASDDVGKALDQGGARWAAVSGPMDYDRPGRGALAAWV